MEEFFERNEATEDVHDQHPTPERSLRDAGVPLDPDLIAGLTNFMGRNGR